MKSGQILASLITKIYMFLAQCLRLETSSRPFNNFNETKIEQSLPIVSGFDIYHFQFSLIHPFKKVKHWKLDMIC